MAAASGATATFCGDSNENSKSNADSTTGLVIAITEGEFGQRGINLNDLSTFQKQLQESKNYLKNCTIKPLSSNGCKTSKVWEHFGHMYFDGKLAFSKYVFCILCFYPIANDGDNVEQVFKK